MQERVHLLGIPLDAVTREEAVERIHAFLRSSRQHHVMTPNAEMLVETTRNPAFASVLRSSALNLPDSQGVVWAAKLTGQHLPERVTGVDTVAALCASLPTEVRVFLLGAGEGVAAKAAEVLHQNNTMLSVVMTLSGSPADAEAESILRSINHLQPHLLLVAFGAPVQDLWIAKHLSAMPGVRVAMGVGGTFDFLAGVQVRAPQIFQRLGLEWLWRFAHDPSRWKRMWKAVVVFPVLVLLRRKA